MSPVRTDGDGPAPPERKRRTRSYDWWDAYCAPGGQLDREMEVFDRFHRLGDHSEDRCKHDGFYGAKRHWTSRRNPDGSRKYVRVHTQSVQAQERGAASAFVPGGEAYESASDSYADAHAEASAPPSPDLTPLHPFFHSPFSILGRPPFPFLDSGEPPLPPFWIIGRELSDPQKYQ